PVAFRAGRDRPQLHVEGERAVRRPAFLLECPAGAVVLGPVVEPLQREQQLLPRGPTAFGEGGEFGLEGGEGGLAREGENDQAIFLADDLDLPGDGLETFRIERRGELQLDEPPLVEATDLFRRACACGLEVLPQPGAKGARVGRLGRAWRRGSRSSRIDRLLACQWQVQVNICQALLSPMPGLARLFPSRLS